MVFLIVHIGAGHYSRKNIACMGSLNLVLRSLRADYPICATKWNRCLLNRLP